MKCAYVCNNILDERVLWFKRHTQELPVSAALAIVTWCTILLWALSRDLLWIASQTSSSLNFIDPGDLATPTLMEPFVMEISTPTI